MDTTQVFGFLLQHMTGTTTWCLFSTWYNGMFQHCVRHAHLCSFQMVFLCLSMLGKLVLPCRWITESMVSVPALQTYKPGQAEAEALCTIM